ncbi:hypothetical protein WJX74_008855 [Apatococcus lobatus]|uniref:Uncharacterized protein n=1 Tax=Apatococcus lobatus TaxID=904363 RepID=A0AAW1RF12_9CHLO
MHKLALCRFQVDEGYFCQPHSALTPPTESGRLAPMTSRPLCKARISAALWSCTPTACQIPEQAYRYSMPVFRLPDHLGQGSGPIASRDDKWCLEIKEA